MHFKNGISEYVLSTGSGLFAFLGIGSWANFQADHLYKRYKCGRVKAYKKGRGLASGCCPSLKNNNNNLILILRAFHEMIKRALQNFYL